MMLDSSGSLDESGHTRFEANKLPGRHLGDNLACNTVSLTVKGLHPARSILIPFRTFVPQSAKYQWRANCYIGLCRNLKLTCAKP